MTRGFVRARYAFALRAIPGREARDAFSVVSVVLTVAVTRSVGSSVWLSSCVVRPRPKTGRPRNSDPRNSGSPGGWQVSPSPALASEYHTAPASTPPPVRRHRQSAPARPSVGGGDRSRANSSRLTQPHFRRIHISGNCVQNVRFGPPGEWNRAKLSPDQHAARKRWKTHSQLPVAE